METLEAIRNVSHKIKWRDIENLCRDKGYTIKRSKKGFKVYVNHSIWSVHLEHRKNDELKQGCINQFKRVLIKENQL